MLAKVIESFTSQQDFYFGLVIEHLAIAMVSVLIAGVLGLIIGILISEFQKSSGFVLSVVNIIYTIPSISLLGFLIPLSGIGNKTAIIALTIYALLPMVRNTHTGITHINPAIVEAAKGMGSTEAQLMYKIKLPLAMPVIISGLRNMVVMTIALTGIASFVGAGGLGVAIYRGITTNNMAMTICGSVLIAIIAFVMDFAVSLLEKLVDSHNRGKRKRYIIPLAIIGLLIAGVLGSSLVTTQNKTINIATKPMTEQYILGEMLKELIETDTGLEVKLTQGVGGGTSNIFPGLESGSFDLYPEYTGTGWNAVLGKDSVYNETEFDEMNEIFKNDYDMEWLGFYGFNNTYGIAVRRDLAEQHNLKTYSDLVRVSQDLTFGAEYDFFEREDGYEALKDTYGLAFKKTMDMDIGLKYQAMAQGEIDVMNIFTTDGQLSVADVVVLEDDKQMYPSYLCGHIVREELLSEHPEIRDILASLDDTIDDAEMAEMNYRVETDGEAPAAVAHEFLTAKGLLAKETK